MVEYAEYGVSEDVEGYVTLADHIAIAPSSRWVQDNRRDRIVTTASDARLELDLTRAGVGKMVLPTFIGDTIRVSLSADAVEEVRVGYEILKALGLPSEAPELARRGVRRGRNGGAREGGAVSEARARVCGVIRPLPSVGAWISLKALRSATASAMSGSDSY